MLEELQQLASSCIEKVVHPIPKFSPDWTTKMSEQLKVAAAKGDQEDTLVFYGYNDSFRPYDDGIIPVEMENWWEKIEKDADHFLTKESETIALELRKKLLLEYIAILVAEWKAYSNVPVTLIDDPDDEIALKFEWGLKRMKL